MSLNNNQEDNNQSFDEGFSEELENFDSDPTLATATETTASKSKGGWLFLLLGIIGTGVYLGYRYYMVPQSQKAAAPTLAQQNETTPPPANISAMQVAKSDENANKLTRQEHKNVQFEQLKNALFNNNSENRETKKIAVAVPPAESRQKNASAPMAAEVPNVSISSIVATPSTTPTPASVGDAVQQVTQLNQRLETNIQQIQHLEEVLQGITQTIAKLNSDINAMDNRLLALSNSTGNLSTDVGTMKNEMSSVKRVLGEEGVLDTHVPPPPSHTYLKASQLASARPKKIIPAYVVHAIIPGRAWLKANNGQIMTVTEGDTLGDYGKVLVIDAASGMVLTSSGNTFQ